MQAIVLEKPGHFTTRELPPAGAPGPGEAKVRVHRVGICGTDLSGYLGKMPFYSYPRIPGHELGVEVLAVGDGMTNVTPGQTCSVEPYLNCQTCSPCRRGRGNCCENLQVLGVHTDGGLRPEFIVPARKLHPSAKLTLEQLALVETLGIGCHAVQRAAPQAGEQVLVVGAGPIGLSVIEFVKLTGAEITVLDLNEQRLRFCRASLGVAHTVQAKDEVTDLATLRDLTSGALYPAVFDATGHPKAMAKSLEYLGFAGRLVYVGIVPDALAVPDPLFHRREMTLLASRNALPDDFGRIIQLIEEGLIDTRPWITHRVGFGDLIERFPSFTKPETGVIKAIVEL